MYYRNKRKTNDYLAYQEEFLTCVVLEESTDTPSWPFGTDNVEFDIEVGLSSKLADLDNVLKPIFDTYQNIYEEFNDKTVYKIRAEKYLVDRGNEYVSVEVRPATKETERREDQTEETKQ